jgi:hypothetical protein
MRQWSKRFIHGQNDALMVKAADGVDIPTGLMVK